MSTYTFEADWLALESLHFLLDEGNEPTRFNKAIQFEYPSEKENRTTAVVTVPGERIYLRQLKDLIEDAVSEERDILVNTDDESDREDIEHVISGLHKLYRLVKLAM